MEKGSVGSGVCRLVSFDLLKLLAIYLVLWGHCVQQLLSAPAVYNEVYLTIYSFHMPLFMMLSGYFARSSMLLGLKDFLRKKGFQLLVPLFSWVTLIFVFYVLFDWLFPDNSIGRKSLAANLGSSVGNFWFLKSLFASYLIAWCGERTKLHFFCWGVVAVLCCQLVPFWNVKVMFPCFFAGMAISRYKRELDGKTGWWMLVFSAFVFFVLLMFWRAEFLLPSDLAGAVRNMDAGMVLYTLYVRVFRIVIGVSGALALLLLFDKLSVVCANSAVLRFMASYGKYTLEVYMLQTVLLEILLGSLLCLDSCPGWLFNYIVSPVVSALMLALSVFLAKIIYKSSFLSLLLFAKR
jgi:fucose 4-O-acetylase-like acetyltransferase